jgi:Holliday junction resolvase RusA-like endonuclease
VRIVNISELKDKIYQLYFSETGIKINIEEITQDEAAMFCQWFNRKFMEGHQLIRSVRHKIIEVSLPNISSDISSKVSDLSQYHCPICRDSSFPIKIINIRIPAQSKQAMDKNKRKAFELAVSERIEKDFPFSPQDKLCLHIVFVIGLNSRDKDLDNMSKALLDALKGNLFEDDLHIDHLSLLKIKYKGDDDYITINIRHSNINTLDDVLVPYAHARWGTDVINLDDYINRV